MSYLLIKYAFINSFKDHYMKQCIFGLFFELSVLTKHIKIQ
jgi:hypothetical protein